MALIKSSQLVQTGTAVVAGDRLVPEAELPAPLREEAATAGDFEADGSGFDQSDVDHLPDEESFETEIPPDVDDEASDGNPAEAWSDEDPEAEDDDLSPTSAVADIWDTYTHERDSLLQEAAWRADSEAEEARRELGAPDASLELDEAAAAIRAVYPEGSQAHDQAMEAVVPRVEAQAAAGLERAGLQAMHDARWRELATVEEQLASLVDNHARRVMADPPPEFILQTLLAERETYLAEARLQAEQIRQNAEAEAARIVHEAHAQAARTVLEVETQRQQMLEELRQTGYAEGYQEGRSQADEEGAKHLRQGLDTLNKLAGLVESAAAREEEKLLKLALGIAERVMMTQLDVHRDTVLRAMDAAVAKVSDLEEVVVKFHPDDEDMVRSREENIRDRLRNVRKVDFQASPKIQPGGVFIETASGTVDAQIRTQLSVIQEAFDAVRREYDKPT
jgi:flagellar assembly protein FliH